MCSISNKPVFIGKDLGAFKDKAEALTYASGHKGSEAVYQTKDGQWHAAEITDKAGAAIHSSDKAEIDKTSMENRVGASAGTLSLSLKEDDGESLPVSEEERINLAKDPKTAKEVLKVLAKDDHPAVRQYVAQNENTPKETLKVLAKDTDEDTRKGVAYNKNTPKETLNSLGHDSSWDVKNAVAGNEHTSPDVLRNIFKSAYAEGKSNLILVFYSLANNPSTPADVLRDLGKSKNDNLLRHLANNPNAPKDLLKELSQSAVMDIKEVVAQNPSTPPEILTKLAKDPALAGAVVKNPATPKALLKELAKTFPTAVAENPAASPELLKGIYSDLTTSGKKDDTLKRSLAINLNTPPEVLRELSKSDTWLVRQPVAMNPNTPVDILEEYSHDKSATLREYALENLKNHKK
jgi:hypothetical protein